MLKNITELEPSNFGRIMALYFINLLIMAFIYLLIMVFIFYYGFYILLIMAIIFYIIIMAKIKCESQST